MLIKVTKGHIVDGIAEDCRRCPVALALCDAYPEAYYISVGDMFATINSHHHLLPSEAQCFIWDFDAGRHVEPFEFGTIT